MSATATENHTMRVVDLSLFPTLSLSGGAAAAGFPPARFVAGRSKEAQRFISCLLTRLGSVVSDPEMGSEFQAFISTRANAGFFYDIESIFSAEALRVIVWLNSVLPSDRPADERIVEASLSDWGVNSTSINMSVSFTFGDGAFGTILVPVSLPVPENKQ